MNTVAVGFGDAVSTPEVCFSLREMGFEPCVVCKSELSRKTLHWIDVKTFTIADPEVDFDQSLRDLNDQLAVISPRFIFAADDGFLLLINTLQKNNALGSVEHLGPGPDAARVAFDKWAQIQNAAEAGFKVPATLRSATIDDVRDVQLPFFLKPRFACEVEQGPDRRRIAKRPSRLIEDIDDYHSIVNRYDDHDFLLQQPIYGRGEGYFGIRWDDTIYNPSAHSRVRMIDPHGSGSSACASREPTSAEADISNAMLDLIDWQGVFMIETLVDQNGERWFVELNGRSWGSLALARRLGFEYPGWLACASNGEDIPSVSIKKPGNIVVRHLGRDILHFLAVVRGPKTSKAGENWPKLLPTLLGVFVPVRPSMYYNYSSNHSFFFIKESIAYVWNRVIGRRR